MSLFQKFFLAVRFIGFWPTVRTILYALYRDWLDRRFNPPDAASRQAPGLLHTAQPAPRGGTFRFQNGFALEIAFLAPDLVRTTWTPGALPLPYALADGAPSLTDPLDLAAHRDGEAWVFSTAALTLSLYPDGTLAYADPSGQLLHRADPPTRAGSSWTQTASLHPGEQIFGLGERAAPLNLRGGTYRFWNTDPAGSYGPGADPLYVTVPAYIGRHQGGSYLVFHENPFDGEIRFPASESASQVRFSGGALRTYFAPGSLPHLTRRFSDLTGRAPLPPRWALGFHQSRWGYMTERDIRQVVEGFQQHHLPLSAIHLDIDYMHGFRVFTVDQTRFPNLGRLASDLDAQGIKLVTILDPGVKRDRQYDVYREGLAQGVFCGRGRQPVWSLVWPGWCAHPDFTHPQARAWWGGYYARLLDQGVAGIWHDMNEPAAMAAWGELTLPRATRHHLEGRGGDHLEAHNLYGLLMNRAGYEALQSYHAVRTGKRPWLLSRSGWAGNQRYAWNWTGDTESTWDALRMTIPQVLNLGLSGFPFTGPDIGGFSGTPDAELFTRWFQMAAFLPFFRIHSAKGTPPREPWVFGEPALSICRDFLNLRQRLMPYLYTLAWEASQTGAPLVRPLSWLEAGTGSEGKLWDVDDVFLLGNDLLIAPVLEPGATLRRIPLPAGRWVNFWRDDVVEDGDFVETQVTLERIPVLARGGSILPMAAGDVLELHVYPDREGQARGVLYSDAGDGSGSWRVDRFEFGPGTRGGALSRSHEGEYPFPYREVHVAFHSLSVVP